MIRKYHNHKLQTNLWHHEEEPHNNHETPGIKSVYNKRNPRKVYLFSKANWEEIYSACENLSVKFQNMVKLKDSLEEIWTTFKTEIQNSMDTFIPSKTFKKNNTVPWFNRKLKRMCRRKARLYKHAKKSKQWMEFKQYQTLCKKGI